MIQDKSITVTGFPANTPEQKECANRLLECRDWIDEQLNIVCKNYNVPDDFKKFVFDMVANVVLYTQETTSAVYRYSADEKK